PAASVFGAGWDSPVGDPLLPLHPALGQVLVQVDDGAGPPAGQGVFEAQDADRRDLRPRPAEGDRRGRRAQEAALWDSGRGVVAEAGEASPRYVGWVDPVAGDVPGARVVE